MQMHTKAIVPLFTLFTIGFTTPVLAEFTPGSYISKDGAQITPTLQTGLSSTDNFFNTATNEDSRLIWNVTPNVQGLIQDGPDQYFINLGSSTSFHNKDTTDNFTQVNIGGGLHKEFTSQHRIDSDMQADWLYEPRGSGLTEGLGDTINELVKYKQQNLNASYEYGSLSSKAQIALKAGFYNKEYENFKAVSQYRNYDKKMLGIVGYYNTQAAARTFLEVREEFYRYDVINPAVGERDSDDLRVLVGIEWEATALTAGSFKLGYQDKDFNSPLRNNFSGLSWEGGLTWQPLTYSTVELMTSRSAKDPLVAGDYIRETQYTVKWNHFWSDYLSSDVSFNYMDEQYTGDQGRQDKTKNSRLALNYITNSFGMVSTYVDFIDKDSTQDILNFDRFMVGINFTFALKAN